MGSIILMCYCYALVTFAAVICLIKLLRFKFSPYPLAIILAGFSFCLALMGFVS